AYSFDQSVLRAELLSARYEPSLIVVGLIPDDIHRCEYDIPTRTGSMDSRVITGELRSIGCFS
ncbi:MAG: hypothetical protein H8D77_02350, partial [Chloroflexi bacterium]|nr:hypothetical protein [Chloroflexota bacterium]